jgi:excinuclease ABC subunit C
MLQADFENTIRPNLPDGPGVYKFLDEEGKILYVGKAKSLKKRVSSYFIGKKNLPYKTTVMVRNARDIDCVLVETESDALLLENILIKKHQPRYNVNLKDAKTYTYICVKNERFPRVFFTRRVLRDGSQYFGPYTSKYKARIVLDLIKSLFPIRSGNSMCAWSITSRIVKAPAKDLSPKKHTKRRSPRSKTC